MEYLSHLQGEVDEQKPSLFELLSEQQLLNLIPPSLRYLLALATHRHPRYLLRILNSFDELYALVALVVEHNYLRTYAGSFTENFYGLKRERVLRIKGGETIRAQLGAPSLVRDSLKLRRNDIYKNLFVIVGIPYIKRKLDEAYDIHTPAAGAILVGPNFRRDELPADATTRQRLHWYYKWFLRHVYPHVNAAYYVSILAFQLGYLFDGTKYSSPFLWMIGSRMRMLGEADYKAFETSLKHPPWSPKMKKVGRPGTNTILNPRFLIANAIPRLLSSMRILLPASIFALKFLEWWHGSDFARQLSRKGAEGLELPPPILSGPLPASLQALKNTVLGSKGQAEIARPRPVKSPLSSATYLPILTVPPTLGEDYSGLCPICLNPITTATATPYGYVYCYVCIHKWVDGQHDRQLRFMEGGSSAAIKPAVELDEATLEASEVDPLHPKAKTREYEWESGKGRCAVSGKRILGGTEGLRRVVV